MLSECTQTQRGTSASPNGSNGGGSSSGIGSNSASSSTSGTTTSSSSSSTTSTSSSSSSSGNGSSSSTTSSSSNMAISRVPSPPPPEASTPVAENWCYTQVSDSYLLHLISHRPRGLSAEKIFSVGGLFPLAGAWSRESKVKIAGGDRNCRIGHVNL